MSHTPGQWEIVYRGGRPYQITDPYGVPVTGWGGISRRASTEGQANARLIAAAPEMAEMLDNLWHFLDAQAKATQNGGARFHISSLAADVKKLLAKATGVAE